MRDVFKVRVNYKSGIQEEFECIKFSFKKNGSGITFEWEKYNNNGPLLLGVDDVESVWQISNRKVLW